MKTNQKGFTLIELLVVIAIIAILAAILFPVFARAREKARQTTCTSNQRQIAASLQMYAQDHEETLPGVVGFWTNMNLPTDVLVCPTLGKTVSNGYVYNSLYAGVALGNINSPDSSMLTGDGFQTTSRNIPNVGYLWADYDTTRHSGGMILSYADGHVLWTKSMFIGNAQNVTWVGRTNVTVNGNTVTKTSGSSAWNTDGASSKQVIRGDGYIQWQYGPTCQYVRVSLQSYQDPSGTAQGYNLQSNSGTLWWGEPGIGPATFGVNCTTGDVMRIERVGQTMYVKKNGTIIRTGQVPSVAPSPLVANCSMHAVNDGLQNAVISGEMLPSRTDCLDEVVWVNTNGLTSTYNGVGSTLAKTGGTNGNWDANAFGGTSLYGDGYVQWTAAQTNLGFMIGLSDGMPTSYTSLKYALYCTTNPDVCVYESGAGNPGAVSRPAYTTGTQFRIQRTGTTITYSAGGKVIYTSTVPSYMPLRAVASFCHSGATASNIQIYGSDL